ncbi:hypothetical protein THRCLA_20664 [Thraustotheca clavata]|uniref:Transposase n=1 Tax=Thraustotheca clavata TaxID=74557 RepID=A0A1W0A5H0_9STRA|nr:hypothetical protein THRCLA_20664 [Thraustotheca clavata]
MRRMTKYRIPSAEKAIANIKTWLPPMYWNVSKIDYDIVARTNNPLERFNRTLISKVPTPHPSLSRFIQN